MNMSRLKLGNIEVIFPNFQKNPCVAQIASIWLGHHEYLFLRISQFSKLIMIVDIYPSLLSNCREYRPNNSTNIQQNLYSVKPVSRTDRNCHNLPLYCKRQNEIFAVSLQLCVQKSEIACICNE